MTRKEKVIKEQRCENCAHEGYAVKEFPCNFCDEEYSFFTVECNKYAAQIRQLLVKLIAEEKNANDTSTA